MTFNGSRTNSMDSTDGAVMEKRIHELREEYNANMDSYRKVKYTADSPEGQRAVDNIVRVRPIVLSWYDKNVVVVLSFHWICNPIQSYISLCPA